MWDKVLRCVSLCACALGLYWMRWPLTLPFSVSWWTVRGAWSHCLWRPSWIGTAVTALWHGCEWSPAPCRCFSTPLCVPMLCNVAVHLYGGYAVMPSCLSH